MASSIDKIDARIADLKRKLSARKGIESYKRNCQDIEREIENLEKREELVKKQFTAARPKGKAKPK